MRDELSLPTIAATPPPILIGTGRLYIGDRAVCDAIYHLVAVGAPELPSDAKHWCGVIRRLDGGRFDELASRADVALDLLEQSLWWPCTVGLDGWASSHPVGPMALSEGRTTRDSAAVPSGARGET
jgi:hypothetical protein